MRTRFFLVAFVALIFSSFLLSAAKAQDADLAVSKAGPDQAAADTDITYTINVVNNGPDDSAPATLTDALPAGTTFVSLSKPASWSCSTPSTATGGTVTCSTSTLLVGTDDTFTLVVHIDAETSPGTFITNVASVSSATDPYDENDSASATTFVPGGTSADLSVTKTADADQVLANSDVTYTIQVSNDGPDPAVNAEWDDLLPSDMTFVSLAQTSGPVWSCTTPGQGSGGNVQCTKASLAAGTTSTFTLVGHIPGSATSGGTYINAVSVTSSTGDPNSENNNAEATTAVVTAAPSLTTQASPSVMLGGSISDMATLSGGA
ncbi:MAG: hypothetical protein QOD99_572, partial [Chthoniobacter sp.]|nr:hypothetical protein [Chthoniobacter sp.]